MAVALKQQYSTALVTGASRGLGAAFAEMLVGEGVAVWGTSRRVEKLPAGIEPVAMDLADPDSVDRAWREAEQASGGIDLLVNNAGSGIYSPYAIHELSAWEEHMQVLFRSPARLCWHALKSMSARGRGCIVNVSSLAVDFPIPYMSSYNAGKAALSALSASLELEARAAGVTVLDLRPGDIRTDFNRSMAPLSASPEDSAECSRVWQRLEENVARAPGPALVARDLRRALLRRTRGTVRSGGFFQVRMAPILARLVPERVARSFTLRYFGLR